MNELQAIVLGVVQGLTEFLPISSSAHLIIVPWLFGWQTPGLAFDAAVHLGTLAAVIVYFWRDLLGMLLALPLAVRHPVALLRSPDPGRAKVISSPERDQEARLALLIAIGTVPGVIAGLVGQEAIAALYHADGSVPTRAIVLVAIAMIALAGLLWMAERMAAHQRRMAHLTWRDAVTIGLAQAAALIPGVSRAGATLTAGLFQGLNRADAARFSFLLGVPIVAAAGGKGLYDAFSAGLDGQGARIFAAGMIASAIAGFAAISWLLRYLQRSSTLIFVLYRFGMGLFLLSLVVVGFR
ncbi:MAG: undecaprenyl-diphosphate phosphatase [Chloroflexia bacterium]|nr:undecaprenyl-diphosphate phosphatase [Chloroflexia bacterium]MDQ3413318.1 UDP-diphosphatase [Chloroflexota bacterium]